MSSRSTAGAYLAVVGLERYQRMRDFRRTPEPVGKVRKRRGSSFVVQKHAASHLHYDFRLELDGVLESWSVPKGPSHDPRERRLAVQVEPHPVEYGRFEGTIPEGEYGGGTVMLWDRGSWEPIGDPRQGLEKGHLDFVLHGERLKGRWTLVRLRPRRDERARAKPSWFLFKRSDEHAGAGDEPTETATTSVATGRTMEEIAGATGRKKKVWRSNREPARATASPVRARMRAAAREGRTRRPAAPRTAATREASQRTRTAPEHAKRTAHERAERTASERATGARAKRARTIDDAPRKWEVAPRESAYRGPTRPRALKRDTGAGVLVAGVRVSNGDRLVDPRSGCTKLDVARYYASIADRFLAFAARRPLALVRCPEGSAGQCFFQKHSHPGMAQSIHLDVDPHGEELLSVTTTEGVVALAQWGAVELHGWGSRVDTLENLERPDWIVMDLDPGPAIGWDDVVQGALDVRARLAAIGLASFVKTTGGKGLHVVVPLVRRHDWDTVKSFSHALALDTVDRDRTRFVATMSKRAREGRIFVDYLRNVRGATAVLPYSARARDGLPVAMPLAWEELHDVDPISFRVATVPGILRRRRKDPWAALPRTRQSMTAKVLAALDRR